MRAERNVAGIIPIFNPDGGLLDRVDRLANQVDLVIVVDDGSSPNAGRDADLSAKEGVVLIRQSNLGIAAALNNGIREAVRLCPDLGFIMTVDQDSTLAFDYIQNAVATFELAARSGVAVGAVCAERFNDWRVTPRKIINGFCSTLEVAQSGMLIPIRTLQTVGYFDEGLFIDCVDTEFVFRMLDDGLLVIIGEKCSMEHEVGQLMYPRMLGRPVKVGTKILKFSFHSALRRYYISRNRMLVYRKNFRLDPAWIIREIIFESRTVLLSVLFGPGKIRQLLAIGLGIFDGVLGRTGKASSDRARSLESSLAVEKVSA